MDENLLSLLEELSLRATGSEDENQTRSSGSTQTNYASSSSVSSPTYDQLSSSIADEDLELKSAVNSLFQDLKPSYTDERNNYDRSKLLVALLGNIDLVTCAVKKINHLVSLGKKMEQIYRTYYRNPTIHLDLNEMSQLISAFSQVYNSESYIREVNVSRVYKAYHVKLMDIYNSRISVSNMMTESDEQMMT